MRPEVTSLRAGKKHLSRRSFTSLLAATTLGMTFTGSAVAQAAPSSKMAADDAHEKALSGEIYLIDIRTPEEWAETGIGQGAIALDMRGEDFVNTLVSLRNDNPEKPIALICRTGNRTGYVVDYLASRGFPGLVDVAEGMAGGPNGTGWLNRGLPVYAGTKELIEENLTAIMP